MAASDAVSEANVDFYHRHLCKAITSTTFLFESSANCTVIHNLERSPCLHLRSSPHFSDLHSF
jgi:hypothetical protein